MRMAAMLVVLILLSLSGAGSKLNPGSVSSLGKRISPPNHIGQKHTWKPTESVLIDLYARCYELTSPDESSGLVRCVSDFMRNKGARAKAISLVKLMDGEGFLTSFTETGKVDIGRVYLIFKVNSNDALVFLNGEEPILYVEGICCASPETVEYDTCECPGGTGSARLGYHPKYQSVKPLPDGGQRFVIRYETRSCNACKAETYIYNAYDFDARGRFITARFQSERAVKLE